jgi:hypothetical protein
MPFKMEYGRREHVACMGEMRNAYKILFRKPEGKSPQGRLRNSRENNIRTDLREKVWEVVDFIHLPQDNNQWLSLVNTVMYLQVP